MPRVKIDYVVSFSSEDPDNPASNLLGWEVSKNRWLCAKGEPSCSVVLQLTRAVKINAVHVGAYHAALVEVLVGRSETPNEPFQVLVPSCVFLSPAEARRVGAGGAGRVRSFGAEQLAPARAQRWDRVRLVCSQPYNKHCKYGLNFVHIYTSEGAEEPTAAPAVAPALPSGRFLLPEASSSDDEFTPGELFNKHRTDPGHSQSGTSNSNTGAQIRQATSNALKNISNSSTKLIKTPISKPGSKRSNPAEDSGFNRERQRDDLMYTDDDDRPHAKIDQVIQKHKDEKNREEAKNLTRKQDDDSRNRRKQAESEEPERRRPDAGREGGADGTPKDERNGNPSAHEPRPGHGGRHRGDEPEGSRENSRKGAADAPLAGAVLALSGYLNPQRAAVRDLAVRLGARVLPDWSARCTHLICAFPNTPKLRQARAERGGGLAAATADWLHACHARRRMLPWRWYATDPAQRLRPPPDDDPPPPADDEECDTDDEIEEALRQRKRRRTGSPARDASDAFDADTADEASPGGAAARRAAPLGAVFGGARVALHASAAAAADARLLERYIRAYGGILLEAERAEEAGGVDYVVSAVPLPRASAPCVRPDWVWRCHESGTLWPLADYLLTD